MARRMKDYYDEELSNKAETFLNKIKSDMHYQSSYTADELNFHWLDDVEEACPYIDNIVRIPKVTLISEENVEKIDKAKKITVESVKHLARNTHFIDEYDQVEDDVRLSNILDVRNEETFNTYENRFAYTLIHHLSLFIMKQEEILKKFEAVNDKVLEYKANSIIGKEIINVEMKITSETIMNGDDDNFADEIEEIKRRVHKIKQYISSWNSNIFMKSLTKDRVPEVKPPIKKTNLILRNPNFQQATKLWEFLLRYSEIDNDNDDSLDTDGDEILRGVLDYSMINDYAILDTICASKRSQKEKLRKYSVLMVQQMIKKSVSLLYDAGIDVTDKEIMEMIGYEINREKEKRLKGNAVVKDKFKSALEEYLEQMNKNL